MRLSVVVLGLIFLTTPATAQNAPPAKPDQSNKPATTAKELMVASRLTFSCDQLAPEEAVKELSKVLGFPLESQWGPQPMPKSGPVTMHESNQPYWAVVGEFCRQTKTQVTPNLAPVDVPFAIYKGFAGQADHYLLPSDMNASVVPAITGFQFDRYAAEKPPHPTKLYVKFHILAEPRIFLAACSRMPHIDEAVDDKGNNLMSPATNTGIVPADKYQYVCWNMFPSPGAWLKYPGAGAKGIKKLRGKMTYVFGFDLVEKDISGVLKGKTETLSLGDRNSTITFSRFGAGPQTPLPIFKMRMSVPRVEGRDGPSFEKSHQFRSMRLILTDTAGRELKYTNPAVLSPDPDSDLAQGDAYFQPFTDLAGHIAKERPAKLIVRIPKRVEEITVPFEFTEVNVP